MQYRGINLVRFDSAESETLQSHESFLPFIRLIFLGGWCKLDGAKFVTVSQICTPLGRPDCICNAGIGSLYCTQNQLYICP